MDFPSGLCYTQFSEKREVEEVEDRQPAVRPQDMSIDPAVLQLIPPTMAESQEIIPIKLEGNVLTVAMSDPGNILIVDELSRLTGYKVNPVKAGSQDIKRAVERHYGGEEFEEYASGVDTGDEEGDERSDPVSELVAEAPAVSMVNSFLESAIENRASDIHIEGESKKMLVRLRIDGVMYDQLTLPQEVHPSIISRVKILAGLDIGEKRMPQDGRFDARYRGQEFDVRASVVPGINGEKAVLRMLPKGTGGLALDEVGFSERHLAEMKQLIELPYGMVLATGPTGSGKTTTLYGALNQIDAVGKNVLTIEDPVEYQISRVTQIQVHPKIGLTFALGLRHILRQDPDVLMVGEIRDDDTLQMSMQAALTGHLVLSTVHCNDAAAAPIRMIDMGAEPFLVASAVAAVISQRLVRRLCDNCKVEYQPDAALLKKLGLPEDGATFCRGQGCSDCRETGYFGRISVFEIMRIEETLETAVVRRASAPELRKICRELGYSTMLQDSIEKAKQGITSLEEVIRAVYIEQ